jgi:hypothetical protein
MGRDSFWSPPLSETDSNALSTKSFSYLSPGTQYTNSYPPHKQFLPSENNTVITSEIPTMVSNILTMEGIEEQFTSYSQQIFFNTTPHKW